ncbi:MAG: helix-turn-helix transcriptional regulator [Bryobacterales bacterium]|nr:helix-turn-helix transcriptional regulator [Bryobacterales bacterium]
MAWEWQDRDTVVAPQINAEGLHVYPFDPLLPLDVLFFRYHGYPQCRSTRHDYFEVFYLKSGEILLEVQSRQILMRADDLLVMGSNLMHRILEYRGARCSSVMTVFLPELIRNDSPAEAAEYLMPFLAQDESFPLVIPSETGVPARVMRLMVQIHNELAARDRLSVLAAKTCLKTLLLLIARHYPAQPGGRRIFAWKQRDLARLRPLFEYLDGHYAEPVTLVEAARIVHISKPSFVRFFKRVTGQSFIAYLNQFRVAKAQELLAASGKSIAEIGQEVGFCDQSYFGALFRRMVHLSPKEYRVRLDAGAPRVTGLAGKRPRNK